MKRNFPGNRSQPNATRGATFPVVRGAEEPDHLSAQPRAPGSNAQEVEVHIDELVLHGFSPGDGRPIADAIENELTRLISRDGLPASATKAFELAHASWGPLRIMQGDRRESTGAALARAIYQGLGK